MEIEVYLHTIAERLRSWRAIEGMTLQQVAARSAVAASTIQKVERQQMVPTIAVLFKVARGLGRSPAELIDDADEAPDLVFRKALACESAGRLPVHLTGRLGDARLSMWRVVHQPGESAEAPQLGRRGEVLIVCERGRLEATLGTRVFSLDPGDTLHCKTWQGLAWRATGDEIVEFVLIGTAALRLDGMLREFSDGLVSRDSSSSGLA